MLVLSRTRGQIITIGSGVEIVVVEIRGDKVRLGIDAPRSVSVHRKEVSDAIARNGEIQPLGFLSPLQRLLAACEKARDQINGGYPQHAREIIDHAIAEAESAA